MSKQKYEAIIGIEIHIALNTETKMYSGESNADVDEPNLHVSPISLGHPGTLPQLNRKAVELGAKIALALNAEVQHFSKFDRKHYFYADLPKGYQISQFDKPLALEGYLDILPDDINVKRIGIERLHLEEDTAKLTHIGEDTLADFNRAGGPLVELVTKPDFRTAQGAKVFVQELQQIVRYIGASEADLSKGHMRCDANVSLRPIGDEALYPKTEVKNMNSFRSIERAIEYEIERQTELWEKNEAPEITTTRGWDDKRQVTVEQRTKEDAADYRYMPEPDIPPLRLTDEEIEGWKRSLPEMPFARRQRFEQEYALSYNDAKVITTDPRVGEYFERVISELRAWLNSLDTTEGSDEEMWAKYQKKIGRLTTAWITTELFGLMKEKSKDFGDVKITSENFAELLMMVYEKKVNSSAAQKILRIMFEDGGDPSIILEEHDLAQTSDEGAIEEIVQKIIADNEQSAADYRAGKDNALKYLMGQVMKETKGKVNPQVATDILKKLLS